MTDEIKEPVHAARAATMTNAEKELQRRSFAYGNTAFENSAITREMVDREAERLAASERSGTPDERG